MLVNLALSTVRQEDCAKFKASLRYTGRLCFKTQKKNMGSYKISLLQYCLVIFSPIGQNILHKINARREGFILVCGLTSRKGWWQDCERVGHMSAVRGQREMDASTQLPSSFPFSSVQDTKSFVVFPALFNFSVNDHRHAGDAKYHWVDNED